MDHLQYNSTRKSLCTHEGSCLSEVPVGFCSNLARYNEIRSKSSQRIRCWVASHSPFFQARSAFKLLSLSRAGTHPELPDAAILSAIPRQCFNFATISELNAMSPPSQAKLAAYSTRKAHMATSKKYPASASDWKLVVTDDGACLQFFLRGIPQRVSALYHELVLGRWPLLTRADYEQLLPPMSRSSERALFRSSYPDPELLARLRNGTGSASYTGLRRPAFIVSTERRYKAAAAEAWRAGFEPTLEPGIYANTSRCRSNASAPGSKERQIINLENVIEAFRSAHKKIIMRNVPHAIFEDDAGATLAGLNQCPFSPHLAPTQPCTALLFADKIWIPFLQFLRHR